MKELRLNESTALKIASPFVQTSLCQTVTQICSDTKLPVTHSNSFRLCENFNRRKKNNQSEVQLLCLSDFKVILYGSVPSRLVPSRLVPSRPVRSHSDAWQGGGIFTGTLFLCNSWPFPLLTCTGERPLLPHGGKHLS